MEQVPARCQRALATHSSKSIPFSFYRQSSRGASLATRFLRFTRNINDDKFIKLRTNFVTN